MVADTGSTWRRRGPSSRSGPVPAVSGMADSLPHTRRTPPGRGCARAGRMTRMEFVLIAVAILVVALITGVSLLVGRGRRTLRLDSDAAAGTTLTRPRPPATDNEAPPPSGVTAAHRTPL